MLPKLRPAPLSFADVFLVAGGRRATEEGGGRAAMPVAEERRRQANVGDGHRKTADVCRGEKERDGARVPNEVATTVTPPGPQASKYSIQDFNCVFSPQNVQEFLLEGLGPTRYIQVQHFDFFCLSE